MNFDISTSSLIASVFWGAVGSGYAIYGWKQKSPVPLAAGIALIAASYFVGSAVLMSAACAAIMVAAWFLRNRF